MFLLPDVAPAEHLFHKATSACQVASQACMSQHIKQIRAESVFVMLGPQDQLTEEGNDK